MAKEAEDNKQEKQVPERPKRSASGMKLPVIIGIVAGVLIVQAVIVLVMFNLFIAPSIQPQAEGNDDKKVEKVKGDSDEDEDSEDGDQDEEHAVEGEENIQFVSTGRITTNPQASDRFVVLDLGLEFKMKGEDEEAKGDLTPMMMAKIKGVINRTIGSLTVEEIHANRDSLPAIIKGEMKPLFKKKNMLLRDVIVQEFILQ